jgi:hypothetical protein
MARAGGLGWDWDRNGCLWGGGAFDRAQTDNSSYLRYAVSTTDHRAVRNPTDFTTERVRKTASLMQTAPCLSTVRKSRLSVGLF